MNLAQWINDYRFALNVGRARRFRRRLLFSQRLRFDQALRPVLRDDGDPPGSGHVIAYPDAIYHITVDDLMRAMRAAYEKPATSRPENQPTTEEG